MPNTKKNSKKSAASKLRKTNKTVRTNNTPVAAQVKNNPPSRGILPSLDKSRAFFLAALLIVTVAGVAMLVPKQINTTATTNALQHVVSYVGEDGQNALDLLKAHHAVAAQQFSIGAFVTSIDGISAPTNYFWAFSVNGKPSDVGADTYITKNSDTLSWQLERIQ